MRIPSLDLLSDIDRLRSSLETVLSHAADLEAELAAARAEQSSDRALIASLRRRICELEGDAGSEGPGGAALFADPAALDSAAEEGPSHRLGSRGEVMPGERRRQLVSRMIYSPDLSTLYVSVPKTGCTTIKTVFAASVGLLEGDVLPDKSPSWIHHSLRGRSETWLDLAEEQRVRLLYGEHTFRFTSVRNPYERLVSCYLNKIADKNSKYHLARRLRRKGEVNILTFLKYVAEESPLRRDVHCRTIVDLCYADRVKYDDIVYYESFTDDLLRILETLNCPVSPIPEARDGTRTDAGSHVHDLLGPEECALIQAIYEKDFDTFGYSRDLADVGHRP